MLEISKSGADLLIIITNRVRASCWYSNWRFCFPPCPECLPLPLLGKIFLNSISDTLFHRCSHITKLPWEVWQKPWHYWHDKSWGGTSHFSTLWGIWPCWLCDLWWLWLPDNHKRRRDNPDGEDVRHRPARRPDQQQQHCQSWVHCWWLWLWRNWLECQLECGGTGWVSSTICLDFFLIICTTLSASL